MFGEPGDEAQPDWAANDKWERPRVSPDGLSFLAGGGEMGKLIRSMNWSATPLGPPESWPQSLRTTLSLCLASNFPLCFIWGPERVQFYNDGYWPMCGAKHPNSLGQDFKKCWFSAWPVIGPGFERCFATGETTFLTDTRMFLDRNGYLEETFFTFSFSPIRDETGGVAGVFHPVTETTHLVLAERRLGVLRDLADGTANSMTIDEALIAAAAVIDQHALDIPFALLYRTDAQATSAHLSGTSGIRPATPAVPDRIALDVKDAMGWPLASVFQAGEAVLVDDLESRFGTLACGPYDEPPRQALLLPVRLTSAERPVVILVVGISPRRPLDEAYRGFYDMLSVAVTTAVANAHAYEEEKHRAEALAEIDRVKTAFFSNVSHEFRTPLTLMLGPLEDLLSRTETLPPAALEELATVHRNGERLLKLVNNLLDFSRIEAGRVQATYEPTDLGALTAELASVFRSACAKVGLELVIDCQPLSEPVYVDHDMWEKIVLNLVSNAFKFTFDGRITVALKPVGDFVELSVEDTGTGIPASEVAHVFERFHRVKNALGRTHEGTGIGLALVQELARLHGGEVRVESVEGHGSTFIVSLPFGRSHLPSERIDSREGDSTAVKAACYVEEALRWLPGNQNSVTSPAGNLLESFSESGQASGRALEAVPAEPGQGIRARVLLADDNCDMRDYIRRLLGGHYDVEAVTNGAEALRSARSNPPDLVLTDVMMPVLDGFKLLEALRQDPTTTAVPVILLSARAGEESRVEGLEAGADDYLIKPFSARELIARVRANLEMSRLRQESARRDERLRAKEHESAILQIQRERLQVTLASIGDAVIATDATGRVNFLNQVACRLTGWTEEEAKGQQLAVVFAIVNEETRKSVENPVEKVLGENRIVGLANHTILICRDGTEYPIEDSTAPIRDSAGNVLGVVMVFRDVTEKRNAEQERRDNEERLSFALASADLGQWDLNLVDHTASRTPRHDQIFGYDILLPEWTYETFLEHVLPEDRPSVDAKFKKALANGTTWDIECRIRRADGAERWIWTRAHIQKGYRGNVERMLGIVGDMTERKLAEEELRKVASDLSEADRRKTEFLATLAHELRNPLAPIRTGLELMRIAADDRAITEQARITMEGQTRQLVRLVDDLLDVSRITSGKITLRMERTDLATAVQAAVDAVRSILEIAGHELTVTFPMEPVYLQADPTRLTQILSNLLINAAKYTPNGGRIRLAAERQGSDAVVTISDTGIGLAPDMLERIFEMFAQVDRTLERSHSGLGIGLTLVKRLVEMHGGSVEARSDGPGAGSEFLVRLPLLAEREQEPLPTNDETFSQPNRLRVLIVDDNTDAAGMLSIVVKLLGNEVETAYDGLSGIEAAEAFRPDVVLMDIGMPRLNGYEAARRIREQTWGKKIVLVALTGWGQEEDRQRTKQAGFNHHFVKPIEPETIRKLLASFA